MDEYAITAKNNSKKFTKHQEKTDSIFEAAAGLFQKKKKTEQNKIKADKITQLYT